MPFRVKTDIQTDSYFRTFVGISLTAFIVLLLKPLARDILMGNKARPNIVSFFCFKLQAVLGLAAA